MQIDVEVDPAYGLSNTNCAMAIPASPYAVLVTKKPTTPGKWESVNADTYDQQWSQMGAAGQSTHGEADFVQRFSPASVLDAGCGTGRVSIELARRGIDVAGVDLDEPFISQARTKAPELEFHHDDLLNVRLDRRFDAVVMAGNVMIFVAPGTEAAVIANMANHLNPGGYLMSGFQLNHSLDVAAYNQGAEAAGLIPAEHWSSWDAEEPTSSSDYAVLVHRK